jgi:hypothetical protein
MCHYPRRAELPRTPASDRILIIVDMLQPLKSLATERSGDYDSHRAVNVLVVRTCGRAESNTLQSYGPRITILMAVSILTR